MKRLTLTKEALVESLNYDLNRLTGISGLREDSETATKIAEDLHRIANEIVIAANMA